MNEFEVVSKPQITPKIKARADEKAQHTYEYVSILRRSATPIFGVRRGFDTTSSLLHSAFGQIYVMQKNLLSIIIYASDLKLRK
jgi:hypothetical protein